MGSSCHVMLGTPLPDASQLQGDELKIVRQLTATISKEGYTCAATVLVQKDAPLDLLLGTDLQTQLGFLYLQRKTDGTAVDLIQMKKWTITPADQRLEK